MTAIDGTMLTEPPETPPVANVTFEFVDDASTLPWRSQWNATLTLACASTWMRLIATAAPMPNVWPVPFTPAFAFAVEDDEDELDTVRSPTPASTDAVPSIVASVLRFAIVSASDPATPTVPPPAPEVASASKACVPAPFTEAVTDTPSPVTPPATSARLVTVPSSIATAAPIAVGPPFVAEPSAVALELVAAADANVTSPPAVSVTPVGRETCVVEVATLTATAAATETAPEDVLALGSGPPPEPGTPAPAAAASAPAT